MPSCAEIQLTQHNRGFAGGHYETRCSCLMSGSHYRCQPHRLVADNLFTVVRVRDWQSLARLYNQHEQYVLFMLMRVNYGACSELQPLCCASTEALWKWNIVWLHCAWPKEKRTSLIFPSQRNVMLVCWNVAWGMSILKLLTKGNRLRLNCLKLYRKLYSVTFLHIAVTNLDFPQKLC